MSGEYRWRYWCVKAVCVYHRGRHIVG